MRMPLHWPNKTLAACARALSFPKNNIFGIAMLHNDVFGPTVSQRFRFALGRCSAIVVALIASIAPSIAAEQDAAAAHLDRTTVTARGKQSALLTLKAFGRYAVTVASTQGVALQSVDRMSGAGPVVGEPGKQDGRLDLFLDRGEYKIVTYASERGSGQAKLSAHAFRELHERPPLLVEHRLERASLGDFEQRSYWLEIKEKRVVALEAAGRHLADLRLWRDGTWLVDVAPQLVKSQARADRPLQIARLTAELQPGLYLLTAYGGPSQPWTEASEDQPFFLRFGIPTLAPAMRQQFTMSEFGVERFLVPAGPNYFRLELPVAHAATLQVGKYDARDPFQGQGYGASIDKRSVPPVAELEGVDGSDTRLVTVTMEAGKPFLLQHFDASTNNRFSASGDYWISSIHAGHAEDSVGATAVLTRQSRYGAEEYLDEKVLELAPNAEWHRRFNLLGELSLFVKIPAVSKIRVLAQGVSARYRFEPFLISRPRDYKSPPWRENGSVFELDRGLYVLSVEPQTKGILDLRLSAPNVAPRPELSPLQAVARFGATHLDGDSSYAVYLNRQPGVASGVVLRPLPIDLSFALPVAQRAGETLAIPVSVPERGTLRALAEDGRMLDMALGDGRTGSAIEVDAGRYQVIVKGTASAQEYALGLEPLRLASRTPLPALPDAKLAGLPKFPVLTPGAPRFLDLKRRSATIQQVHVEKPGLYQFETTGLLHTSGKVRTRTNPSLFRESGNGVGRNFLIQSYLREGDYQLAATTQGETQGHLGVEVTRTDVVDGGELRAGEVARASLPSGQALAYRFRIAQRGTYHLQALGLGRNFKLRLEDDDGWPVFAPVRDGDLTEVLEAGDYRVLVLPQTAEARILTRLDRVAEPKRYKGHGPHRVALESVIQHTWLEPAKGAPRRADQWEFYLPAPAELTITLDNEMEATLASVTDPKRALATIDAKGAWRGPLAAGRYRVQARHSRSNNHVPYSLRIAATQLVAGQSRLVSAPASIPISVGADSLVELQSFGPGDVRARLVDAAGELVAQNDDRPDDWNFHIAQRLRRGEYRLLVDPVNEAQAQTTVSMHAPGEIAEKPLVLGSNAEIKDAGVHVYPLTLPPGSNFLLVSAQSSDAVGLALEGGTAQGWVNLGTTLAKAPYLALPLGTERFQSYRLRAWSADRRSLRVRVRAVAATLPATPENDWLRAAVSPLRVDEARADLRVAMIALARPGTFRLKGDLARLQWSDSGARAAQAGGSAVVSVNGKTLWLVAEQRTPAEAAALAAERLRLPSGEHESLRLELMAGGVGTIDLQPQAQGPSLVIAQARAGQPGVAVGERRDPRAIGLVPGEAVAVALPGATAAAQAWNAANRGASLELDVRQVPLRQGGVKTLGLGISDGTIKAATALPIMLPGGPLRVRLTLSAMNAAVFLKLGVILSTHWAGEDALHETVLTDADQLWLLNADAQDTQYGVEIAPGTGEAEPALKPGELLERNVSTAGRLRVPVEVPKTDTDHYHLRVRGDTQAIWLENGGRITSGNDIAIHDSGVLWLQHQPGTLVAWLEAPRVQGASDWLKSLQETAVKPPQSVSLRGKSQVLSLKLERAAMLHVRTSVPVVTQFVVEGQAPQTEAHLHGANINLLAPAGTSRLVLRAVGADSLSGVATVMATTVTNLAEGAGPEVLLAPASARLFSFEIKQRRAIGIGVRASPDVVHSVLYDERGVVQSEGVVQMPTLAPGRYYLAIEAPADSTPVRVQPIMLGLTEPDVRPPYEILRRYVESRDGGALLYVPQPPAAPSDAAAESAPPAADEDAAAQAADEPEPNQNENEEEQ